MEEMKNKYKILVGTLKERKNSENLGEVRKIITRTGLRYI
jgi:hypothetical protein